MNVWWITNVNLRDFSRILSNYRGKQSRYYNLQYFEVKHVYIFPLLSLSWRSIQTLQIYPILYMYTSHIIDHASFVDPSSSLVKIIEMLILYIYRSFVCLVHKWEIVCHYFTREYLGDEITVLYFVTVVGLCCGWAIRRRVSIKEGKGGGWQNWKHYY